jgi:glycogen synthase
VADEGDSVGFEGCVWVHRIATRNMQQCGYSDVPSRIWNHSAAMNAALEQIREQHPVDVVYAPLWDCEGVACLVAGRVPVVTGLQTTLHFWLEGRAFMREDRSFMETFAAPMLKLERRMLQQSHGLHAISSKILRDLERVYQVTVSPHRGAVIPLGLADWATLPAVPPPSCASFSVRLLFVGRLEERKGIDVLLAASAEVLGEAPHVYLDVVGNDRIPGKDGESYRAKFEWEMAGSPVLRQVGFHGEVDEAALRGFYRSCDVFVGPSRYESFGLVFLEAMMFSKPVIGCRAGAMPELIQEGETGLLADAGSVASLVGCLRELIGDRSRRIALGAAGRRRYETLYTADRMAAQMEKFLSRIAGNGGPRDDGAHGRSSVTDGGRERLSAVGPSA